MSKKKFEVIDSILGETEESQNEEQKTATAGAAAPAQHILLLKKCKKKL